MYIRTIVLQRVANYLHVLVNMISLAVRLFEFHGHWGGGGGFHQDNRSNIIGIGDLDETLHCHGLCFQNKESHHSTATSYLF